MLNSLKKIDLKLKAFFKPLILLAILSGLIFGFFWVSNFTKILLVRACFIVDSIDGGENNCNVSFLISALESEGNLMADTGSRCAFGSTSLCYSFATGLSYGVYGFIDNKMAYSFYDSACESGMLSACEMKNYLTGDKKDLVLQEKMCNIENDINSCGIQGILYMNGFSGLTIDNEKAEKYLNIACDLGKDDYCYFLSVFYAKKGDMDKAKEKYQKCETAEPRSKIGKIRALYFINEKEKAKELIKASFDAISGDIKKNLHYDEFKEMVKDPEIKELLLSDISKKIEKNKEYEKKVRNRK